MTDYGRVPPILDLSNTDIELLILRRIYDDMKLLNLTSVAMTMVGSHYVGELKFEQVNGRPEIFKVVTEEINEVTK